MRGGAGNDTYTVEHAGDVIAENADEGIDTVRSLSTSYTLSDHVENLVLMGTAARGTGNGLDNYLTGNGGNNTLEGLDGTTPLTAPEDETNSRVGSATISISSTVPIV